MATTRITGMASGLDVDSLVKQLMQAERKPLDKLNQDKQLIEWKRENYREVSTKLVTFAQNKVNDIFSKSTSLNAQKGVVSGNTSAVTINATATASGVLDINVTKMAAAAKMTSSANPATSIAVPDGDWGKVKLSDITGSGVSGTTPLTVKVGGAEIQIDPATETLDSFVKKINSNSSAGVTAIYDSGTGKISLTSKTTGVKGNDIKLEGTIFSALKLGSQLTGGADAELTVNGLSITRSSNSFTMNGYEITLNGLSEGKPTHVESSKDIDKIVANVQSFVDSYNELLSYLNGKVNEERYKSYTPLTSDQKSGMSDKEIDLWTEKAKSGMLKRDSILQSTISELRTALIQGVKISGTETISLSQLGITTGSYETRGKLVLDTDKLKTAIQNDPDIVNKFLGNNYAASSLGGDYKDTDGILSRVRKISNQSLANLADTAGTSKVSTDLNAAFNTDSTIGNQLYNLNRRISDLESRLNDKEANYYKKFATMESAINKYNTISSSLLSYLS